MVKFYLFCSRSARTHFVPFLIIINIFSYCSCNNFLGVETKPLVNEREAVFKIELVDSSGFMKKLFNSDKVRNAEITLKSNMLGTEYKIRTDTNGVAFISGILSDIYFITAERIISPEEKKIIGETNVKNLKLVNKKVRLMDLKGGEQTQVKLSMELEEISPLVISEIYACGPSGSGLYYHDKYIEVFNNSDVTLYLDSLVIAVVYVNSYLGIHYRDDPEFVHSKNIWFFPGNGKQFPINPGQFVVCAEDAIDHRINAPNSVDLSHVDFEFYKDDAPDLDNPNIPNMQKFFQDAGNDWLIAGEKGALIVAKISADSIKPFGDGQFLIPYKNVLDGVEYLSDVTQLSKKILNESIDAGGTGGIQFYTGKSMQRRVNSFTGRYFLIDNNNSSVDFNVILHPTPNQY